MVFFGASVAAADSDVCRAVDVLAENAKTTTGSGLGLHHVWEQRAGSAMPCHDPPAGIGRRVTHPTARHLRASSTACSDLPAEPACRCLQGLLRSMRTGTPESGGEPRDTRNRDAESRQGRCTRSQCGEGSVSLG